VKELKNLTSDPSRRETIIKDCVELIDSEVRSKTGLGGVAVRAAYAVVKAFKPRMVEDSVDGLLDEFTAELQPVYARYQEEGSPGSLESYFGPPRAEEVADRLLVITDRRAEKTRHKTVAKAYYKLRPKGREHVAMAAPGIGRVLDKHVPAL
jgi:hypothetical protein